jgi:hypothetical protein
MVRALVGSGTAIVLAAVMTGCSGGTARTTGQLADDLARYLGRSAPEVEQLVETRATTAESSDDLLRRWAAALKEPSALRDDAVRVSCQTVIDLSTSDEPIDERSLLVLINNIAGLEPAVANLQEVDALKTAALEELGGKQGAVRAHQQLERFKEAVCVE